MKEEEVFRKEEPLEQKQGGPYKCENDSETDRTNKITIKVEENKTEEERRHV
jgi:hypothetical protein